MWRHDLPRHDVREFDTPERRAEMAAKPAIFEGRKTRSSRFLCRRWRPLLLHRWGLVAMWKVGVTSGPGALFLIAYVGELRCEACGATRHVEWAQRVFYWDAVRDDGFPLGDDGEPLPVV